MPVSRGEIEPNFVQESIDNRLVKWGLVTLSKV